MTFFNYDDPTSTAKNPDAAIFSRLSDSEWKELFAVMDRSVFSAGQVILRAGDSDRSLYLIVQGTVDVLVGKGDDRQVVATNDAGTVFGEMAFFDGGPRSADVIAVTDVEVLSLSPDRFEQLSIWHPRIARIVLMDLGGVLSKRLRRMVKSN